MKVMVELPEKNYKELRNNFLSAECKSILKKAINKGVVIPDNATNGDVMRAMFSEIQYYSDGQLCSDWWNAPYEKYKKENVE